MSGQGAGGRRFARLVLLASAALVAPQMLHAEDGAAQDQTRERVGPRAEPPRLPDYPQPSELRPLVPPPPVAPPTATITDSVGGLRIREVRVATEGDSGSAIPPSQWRVPEDGLSGLRLEHQSGQPLDADWVRAQFAANFAGDGGSVARAVSLVQLLNRAFLTAGFVNSGIVVPEQSALAEGVLDLRLIYGRLVAVDGGELMTVEWGGGNAAGLSPDYVRGRFPSAMGQPLSAVDIERDFRLLAEDPAIATINVDLRPSGRPGEASLNVTVFPEDRADFYLGVANDRSPAVGGERIFAGGYVRNLLAGGDLLTGEAGITEGLEDFQAGYVVPVLTPRTFLSLRGSYNDAAVIETALLPLDISATDESVEGGLSHRFVQEPLTPTGDGGWSPSRTLSGGFLVTWRRQESFLLGQPFSFAPGSVDGVAEYTALRLTGDYLVRGVKQVLALSLTGTMGLGGTQTDIPTIPNPDDHFLALLAQLNYARRLDDSGLELRGRLTGQIADGVLYSGERLSIGGEFSVRGYRETLFLADQGATGSVELAYPFSLAGQEGAARAFDWGAFTASVFADGAAFDVLEAPDLEESWLGSVGLTLAWNPSDAILARASYGIALNEITLQGGQDPGGGSGRDIQDDGFQFRLVIFPLRLFQ